MENVPGTNAVYDILANSKIRRSLSIPTIIIIGGTILNLALLFLYYYPSTKRLKGDETMYFEQAVAVARASHMHFSLLWPPLYGHINGYIFRLFGEMLFPTQVIQIAMALISGIMWYRMSLRTTSSRIAATATLCLFLFSTHIISYSHYLFPEIFHIFMFTLALYIIMRWQERLAGIALAGLLLGLCLLTKSLLTPFIPFLILYLAVFNPAEWKNRFSKCVILAGAVAITILPVMSYNYMFRGYFTIANSGPLNVWVSLTETELVEHKRNLVGLEFRRFQAAAPNDKTRNMVYRKKIYDFVREKGIRRIAADQISKQYFVLFEHDTFFSQQLPGGPKEKYAFESRALAGILCVYSDVTYALLLALTVIGIASVRIHKPSWIQLFFLFILFNIALFFILDPKTRYRIQFTPFLIFFAGIGVAFLFDRENLSKSQSGAFRSTLTKVQMALVAASICLMEALAFRSLLDG